VRMGMERMEVGKAEKGAERVGTALYNAVLEYVTRLFAHHCQPSGVRSRSGDA
jgi:hypothetical protein